MRYLVIRVKDERSSQLCREIEAKALSEGGLDFPFQHKGYYFDTNDLNRGLSSAGFSRTRTFHENCRCSLVPISDTALIRYGRIPDDVDMSVLTEGALGYSNEMEIRAESEILESTKEAYSGNRVFLLIKYFLSKVISRKNQ